MDEHIGSSHAAGADMHPSTPIHAQAQIESIMAAIAGRTDQAGGKESAVA